jgi:hypothetical protein
MAERDPNERRSSSLIEKPGELPPGIALPPAVKTAGIGTATGQYYAYRVIYADGRSEIEWYKRGSGGGKEQPDPVEFRSEAPVAADIKEKWDKEQKESTKTEPVAAPPSQANIVTRNPDGSLATLPNPNYTPPAGAAGTKDWRPEGTPDGRGGFDNSKPIMAAYVNGQRTGETRQPTGDELKDWYNAAELTRNQGKTDAQIEAERKANKPAAADNVGTPTGNVRQNTAGGTTTKEVEYVLPDGRKEWRTQTASDPQAEADRNRPDTKTETVTKNGVVYTRQVTTPKDGSAPTIRTFGPDGKELPGGIPGDAQIQNAPPFNPDWNKPALGLIEYASGVRARTDLTDEQKAKLIQEAHVLAQATTSQANSVLNTQQTEGGRRTTERGQDTGQANTRLSAASADFGTSVRAAADATKYSLGPEAASVLPYFLAMARATGQAYGGFNTPAAVNPGAAVTQMHGQTIPGLGSMLPATVGAPPAGATDATPPMAPTPPNALGVGAIGDQPAPGGGLPAPIFAPQPVAPPPPAAPPVDPATIGAPAPPQQVPVSPPAGQPGNNPNLPVGMGQGALLAQQAAPMPTLPDLSPEVPMPPGLMYPVDPRPPATYDREGIDRTNDPLIGPPGRVIPWVPPDQTVRQPSPQPGGLAAMLGNAGPWAAQPQPQQPTGMGALLMQRAGGYNPTSVNQILMDSGIDPEVIAMMGGVA